MLVSEAVARTEDTTGSALALVLALERVQALKRILTHLYHLLHDSILCEERMRTLSKPVLFHRQYDDNKIMTIMRLVINDVGRSVEE